jgi:hypothetical protein
MFQFCLPNMLAAMRFLLEPLGSRKDSLDLTRQCLEGHWRDRRRCNAVATNAWPCQNHMGCSARWPGDASLGRQHMADGWSHPALLK